LAQHASGFEPILNTLSAISADDWRKEIIDYLRDPSKKVERRVRFQATKYVLFEEELYYLSVFSPQGVTPTSKFVCVLPFPDGDAKRHKDLSWFGQEKALRLAGEGEFVLFCT